MAALGAGPRQRRPNRGRSATARREPCLARRAWGLCPSRPSPVSPRIAAARRRPAHASAQPRSGPEASARSAAVPGPGADGAGRPWADVEREAPSAEGAGAACAMPSSPDRASSGAGDERVAPSGAGARPGPVLSASRGERAGAGDDRGACPKRVASGAAGASRGAPPGAGALRGAPLGAGARPGAGAGRGAPLGAGAGLGAGTGLGPSGAGAGAGAGRGASLGGGGARGGSIERGSRYACRVPASRTPKCRWGWTAERVPVVPTAPSRSPAETEAPAPTASEERCRYDVSKPSPVRTLTVSPEEPAVPANRTSPPAAATTGVPTAAAMSMPRCCPPAYGLSPFRYGVMTSPRTGQLHEAWAGAHSRRKARRAIGSRRIA